MIYQPHVTIEDGGGEHGGALDLADGLQRFGIDEFEVVDAQERGLFEVLAGGRKFVFSNPTLGK
jgi:hypothetical protein